MEGVMNTNQDASEPLLHDVPEIEVGRLEQELIAGDQVTVIDVRPGHEFQGWSIDPYDRRILNVPLADLDDSLVQVREAAGGGPVRVICAAGRSSIGATRTLIDAGIDAENVTGGMVAWSRVLKADEIPTSGSETVIQFRREARGCLSYMVVSGEEAIVIDPAPDTEPYVREADRQGARIVAVFDTHVHADHISGAPDLAALDGVISHLGSPVTARGLRPPDYPLRLVTDGDSIPFGHSEAVVLTLPGHTTEMTGLVLGGVLFCGDSIFADGIARPDLQDGSAEAARAAARRLHRTITEKVLTLLPETRVLPCHYPGGRLNGPLAPTLGEIFETVPQLAWEEEQFVEWLVSGLPSKPASFEQIIKANLGLSDASRIDLGRLEVGANSCAAR